MFNRLKIGDRERLKLFMGFSQRIADCFGLSGRGIDNQTIFDRLCPLRRVLGHLMSGLVYVARVCAAS